MPHQPTPSGDTPSDPPYLGVLADERIRKLIGQARDAGYKAVDLRCAREIAWANALLELKDRLSHEDRSSGRQPAGSLEILARARRAMDEAAVTRLGSGPRPGGR